MPCGLRLAFRIDQGEPPRAPIPGLLVHDRGHLRFAGKLLGKNFLSVGSPILLGAEIDASSDKRIGIKVDRLPVHYSSDKPRRQALHRGKTLRRIGNLHLKSCRSEQVFLLYSLLLRADTACDTQHDTGDYP